MQQIVAKVRGEKMHNQLTIEIDATSIEQMVEAEVKKNVTAVLWFVDINKLAELTQMSKRFLESEIICDPRMKVIERKRSRKRWWSYPEAMKAIQEITSEW